MKNTSARASESEKFNLLAHEWWQEEGAFQALHPYNAIRVPYIIDHTYEKKGKIDGLSLLDIGCGGGILCEPLAKAGFNVTGIDLSPDSIKVAQTHAKSQGLDITYACESVENHKGSYDIITCMEVMEHIEDVEHFLKAATKRLKTKGLFFFSTLNRTFLSKALAIFMAERVLGLIPRGTHDHHKFIRPSELQKMLKAAGLELYDLKGVGYNPLNSTMGIIESLKINYMGCAHSAV